LSQDIDWETDDRDALSDQYVGLLHIATVESVERVAERLNGTEAHVEYERLLTASEWLSAEGVALRTSWSARLAFVVRASGPPGNTLNPGGFVRARALAEIKWRYINGQFLACIALRQALMSKDTLTRKGFERPCHQALANHLTSSSEHRAFTRETFRGKHC
jgi:hypothetical protein